MCWAGTKTYTNKGSLKVIQARAPKHDWPYVYDDFRRDGAGEMSVGIRRTFERISRCF